MINNSSYRLDNNIIYNINITFTPNFFYEFESAGYTYDFMRLSNNFGILRLNEETYSQGLEDISKLRSVVNLDRAIRMAPLSEVSPGSTDGIVATEEIGVNYFKNNPNISITGRGVIIAVADSGIDYLHPDFIYPDGTSKILYLWDQTKEGSPPEGFYFGTEYTREDINIAIQNNDPSLSQDESGRGTMISGICAGLGNVNPEYAGVAYEADLIVIKLATLEGYFNNAMLFASSEYAYRRSRQLRRPIVINISYGSNNQLGLTNINTTRYYERGYCEVAAAGNGGDTETHTTGRLQYNGDTANVEFELSDIEEELTLDLWVQKPDSIEMEVITPSGERTRRTSAYANNLELSGLLDLEGTSYTITSRYPTTVLGQQYIQIHLRNVVPGIWTIRLIGINIINGIYNLYLPNRVFINNGTRFRSPDPSYTINFPAIREEVLTVGAYNLLNRSLWNSSSRGPTIQNWAKPDIIAPGVNIIAPYPGNTYGTITGTGPSAAHVSGAAALYFQYTLVDGHYFNQAYLSNFKTFIKLGADRESNIDYPNYSYGYGVLNVKRMFDYFR